MNDTVRAQLLALIRGLTKNNGNQYYDSYYIDESGINILVSFIKNA